jgi:L-rhamnose-H+ transport protein
MMNSFLLPVLLVLLASFFQGTFGLGMKYVKPLAWEAWWLVYGFIAMIVIPVVWALLAVPDLWGSISGASPEAVWMGMLFGFLWGVGGILFGLSVSYVGMSLTYGIVMGLAGSIGSLVPLAQVPNVASNPALAYVILGVLLMLVGVTIAAWAGVKRDREQTVAKQALDISSGPEFRKGLLIAISSGILSALLNVGFADAAPVAKLAAERGALTRNSSLAAWVVVLFGAFLMNGGYAVFLLIKNRSVRTYGSSGAGKALTWAVTTGVLWFAALGVYGQGAALMGSMGPVIGWPMLLGLALIISNFWALRAGEWKGSPGPFRLMLAGVAILIVACGILGYSNSLL